MQSYACFTRNRENKGEYALAFEGKAKSRRNFIRKVFKDQTEKLRESKTPFKVMLV